MMSEASRRVDAAPGLVRAVHDLAPRRPGRDTPLLLLRRDALNRAMTIGRRQPQRDDEMKQKPNSKARSRIGPRRAIVLVLACTLVAAGWSTEWWAKQNSTQQASARSRAAASTPRSRQRVEPASEASTWRYEAVTRRNLFMSASPAQQQKAPGLPPVTPASLGKFEQRQAGKAELPVPDATRSAWTYAGYVTVDGSPVAIVENTSTKSGIPDCGPEPGWFGGCRCLSPEDQFDPRQHHHRNAHLGSIHGNPAE